MLDVQCAHYLDICILNQFKCQDCHAFLRGFDDESSKFNCINSPVDRNINSSSSPFIPKNSTKTTSHENILPSATFSSIDGIIVASN